MKKVFFLSAFFLILLNSCSREIDEIGSPQIEGVEFSEEAFPNSPKELVTLPNGITLFKVDSLYVLEGDIVLSEDQVEELGKADTRSAYLTDSRRYWKGSGAQIVFYTISSSFVGEQKIYDAIAHWEANTDIRFWKYISGVSNDYIHFFNGDGNWSEVYGKKGGLQRISLDMYGSNYGTAIHEIGHAVGLFHEQSRTDRDNYINIHWNNMPDSCKHNFMTYTQLGYPGNNFGVFDFNSIMLYSSNAFSNNGQPTITKKDGGTYSAQRQYLSSGDKAAISRMYNLSAPKDIVALTRSWTEYSPNGSSVSYEQEFTEYTFITRLPVANNAHIRITYIDEGGGSGQEYYPATEYTHVVTIPQGSRSVKYLHMNRSGWYNWPDWYEETKQVTNISFPFSYQ